MSELLELAARCEAGEGADRELDALIACAASGDDLRPFHHGTTGDWWVGVYDRGERIDHLSPPHYTASLDAAMTLIDGETFFHVARFSPGEGPAEAHVYPNRHVGDDYNGIGATPALALCAAALRARSTQGDQP